MNKILLLLFTSNISLCFGGKVTGYIYTELNCTGDELIVIIETGKCGVETGRLKHECVNNDVEISAYLDNDCNNLLLDDPLVYESDKCYNTIESSIKWKCGSSSSSSSIITPSYILISCVFSLTYLLLLQ